MTGIIPGQPNGANEVMNAFGSNFNDTAQMIFNADYLGFDNRLAGSGTPNLKNVDYSTFISDDANSTNEMTYDSTNDFYEVDDGATDPFIIVGESEDIGVNITNIIPIVNGFFDNGELINGDFETAIGGEWTYSETLAVFSGAADASEKHRGANSYKITYATTTSAGSAQITQIVDLTNSTHFGFWFRQDTGSNQDTTFTLEIDSTPIFTNFEESTGTVDWNFNLVEIPRSLRDSGKELKIKFARTGTADGTGSLNIDDIATFSEDGDLVLTFSNDNSTFDSCTNKEIFRPATTGQKVLLKIEGNNNDKPGYITEFAIKFNYY